MLGESKNDIHDGSRGAASAHSDCAFGAAVLVRSVGGAASRGERPYVAAALIDESGESVSVGVTLAWVCCRWLRFAKRLLLFKRRSSILVLVWVCGGWGGWGGRDFG